MQKDNVTPLEQIAADEKLLPASERIRKDDKFKNRVIFILLILALVSNIIAAITISKVSDIAGNQSRSQCIRVKQAQAFRAEAIYLRDFSGILKIELKDRVGYVIRLQKDADAMLKAVEEYQMAGQTCP